LHRLGARRAPDRRSGSRQVVGLGSTGAVRQDRAAADPVLWGRAPGPENAPAGAAQTVKRFVRTDSADKRAIQLYQQLRAIEKMPSIEVHFTKDGKNIILCSKDDRMNFNEYSVDHILLLDVQQAIKNGGTLVALVTSRRQVRPRVSQAEVDEGMIEFFSSEN
jgi:hypothetical protein